MVLKVNKYKEEYRLINIPSLKVEKIKQYLDYCMNFEMIQKDFSLYDSITDGARYVPYSINQAMINNIKHSVLFKIGIPAYDASGQDKCKKYLKAYKAFLANPEKIRLANNNAFLKQELDRHKTFFDKIESNPLTKMQRISIITNEDNNLVVAGAGSGKTSVIVGKVLYLLKKRLANANEILILAFNKKAQEEIQERLSEKLEIIPDVKTFHSLGNYILRFGQNQKGLSKLATDDFMFKNAIKAIIQNSLEDSDFVDIMKIYFQEFFYPVPNIAQFKVEGDYYNYLENFEIRTLITEKVRSLEECYIAKFLYLNGVEYEYEKAYPYDCGKIDYGIYKPDFYLPAYDIYIEHFAINKNGTTPSFIDNKKYIEGMKWKRKHIIFIIQTS